MRITLSLVAFFASAAVLSAQLPTPPISDGVNMQDHEVLEKMVRESYKKTDMNSSDEKKAVIARSFIENHLFSKREFNKKHRVFSLGGHSIYVEPSSVLVDASWSYSGKEGITVDGDGYYLSEVDKSECVSDLSSYFNGKSISDFRRERVDSNRVREMIKEDQSLFASFISIDYRPVDIVLEDSVLEKVIVEQTGALQVLATDLSRLYGYDGYELTLTNKTPDKVQVLEEKVITGPGGTVRIRVKGLEEGHAVVRAEFHFSNGKVESEAHVDIKFEVGPAETYRYHASVEDNLKTKISYTLDGEFIVTKEESEESPDSLKWGIKSGPVKMSWTTGTNSSETSGYFLNGRRDNSVIISFDPEKLKNVSQGNILSMVFGGEKEDLMDFRQFLMTGSPGKGTPEYEIPMCIIVPARAGTYSFKFGLDDMSAIEKEGKKMDVTAQVIPGVKRISSILADSFQLMMMGQTPSMGGTITVEKVEERSR